MTTAVPLVERLAEVLRKWREGRCEHCLRTIASDEDWEQIPEGEGEHLCWDYPTCYLSQADPTEAHARALLPVVEQAVAEARGEALREAAEFIEVTSGIGERRGDYASGWYDALNLALAEMRARADAIATTEGA